MATQEFYIRSATETEARGPFTQEQLSSLTEAGQVAISAHPVDGGVQIAVSDTGIGIPADQLP